MKKPLQLLSLTALLLASCSARIGHYSLISTRNADMNHPAGFRTAPEKPAGGSEPAGKGPTPHKKGPCAR